MVLSATFKRYVPPTVRAQIASYLTQKNSRLLTVFQRRIPSQTLTKPFQQRHVTHSPPLNSHPMPALDPIARPHRNIPRATARPMFLEENKMGRSFDSRSPFSRVVYEPKRSFSTQSHTDMWQKKIKQDPSLLCLEHVKDLSSEKMNALISLIEKEGLVVDKISLPPQGLSKESLIRLLNAIGKWQPVLPAFSVVNLRASFHQFKYFFEPSLSGMKECEDLLINEPTTLCLYQMHKIPLKDGDFINQMSDHIMHISTKNPVYLVLKNDGKLAKPPIDSTTGKPDLSPVTHTWDHSESESI